MAQSSFLCGTKHWLVTLHITKTLLSPPPPPPMASPSMQGRRGNIITTLNSNFNLWIWNIINAKAIVAWTMPIDIIYKSTKSSLPTMFSCKILLSTFMSELATWFPQKSRLMKCHTRGMLWEGLLWRFFLE